MVQKFSITGKSPTFSVLHIVPNIMEEEWRLAILFCAVIIIYYEALECKIQKNEPE